MKRMTTYSLLLRQLERGEKVDGLQLAKVNVVAEQKDEDELGDVLALGVSVDALLVSCMPW